MYKNTVFGWFGHLFLDQIVQNLNWLFMTSYLMTSLPWEICKLGVSTIWLLDMVEKWPFLRITSTVRIITDRRNLRSAWNFFRIKFCIFLSVLQNFGLIPYSQKKLKLIDSKTLNRDFGDFPARNRKNEWHIFFSPGNNLSESVEKI